MKNRKIYTIICFVMLSLLASNIYGKSKPKIKVISYSSDFQRFVKVYTDTHPNFPYELEIKEVSVLDGEYQPYLDNLLINGGKGCPDIFIPESGFVCKYSKGIMEEFSLPYKDLGIDDKVLQNAGIAQYTIDIGSNKDNVLKALSYQSTTGCFIYRRSIAKKVFGTDSPEEIQKFIGGGTGNWKKFESAASMCASNDVAIVSGLDDMWLAEKNTRNDEWLVDGKLNISTEKEDFLEIAKFFAENKFTNNTMNWTEEWYKGINGSSEKPVLGYFGPVWFINYCIEPTSRSFNDYNNQYFEGTYGDWAVCLPPVYFYWGGDYIFVNKNIDKKKKTAIKDFIQWMTVDTSENGLLYQMANGNINGTKNEKDMVPSNVVLSKSDGKNKLLKNQNIYDYFILANKRTRALKLTEYDEMLDSLWMNEIRNYANGEISREQALSDFRDTVLYNLGI